MPMPDKPARDPGLRTPLDYIKTAAPVVLPVGGVVGGAFTYLVSQPKQKGYWLVSVSVIGALLLTGFALYFWWHFGKVLGLDGKPPRQRTFPKLYGITSWVGAGLVALTAISVYPSLKGTLVKIAEVQYMTGSLTPTAGQPPNRIKRSYGQTTRQGGPEPVYDPRIAFNDHRQFDAFPAVVASLKRVGTGTVQIEAVHFIVDRPKFGDLVTLMGSIEAPPIIEPSQYLVRIRSDMSEVAAQLYRDGKPSAAVPILNDENPIVRLHIGFEGDRGLYLVKLKVTVRDEDDNTRDVESPEWMLVNTHERSNRD